MKPYIKYLIAFCSIVIYNFVSAKFMPDNTLSVILFKIFTGFTVGFTLGTLL